MGLADNARDAAKGVQDMAEAVGRLGKAAAAARIRPEVDQALAEAIRRGQLPKTLDALKAQG